MNCALGGGDCGDREINMLLFLILPTGEAEVSMMVGSSVSTTSDPLDFAGRISGDLLKSLSFFICFKRERIRFFSNLGVVFLMLL